MENKIKQLISERGISQKELAAQTGMTEAGISRAINGSASRKTISKIAAALNVSEDLLIPGDLPYAKYGSDKTYIPFGSIEVPCYVLNTGQRVLSGRGMQKALGSTSQSGEWLQRFASNQSLELFFNDGENSITERIANPIIFRRKNAGGSQVDTFGYEATLLIDICTAVIDAHRANVYNDAKIIASAEAIIRAVAKVGIIALVDEATGYDKEKNRAKNELQKFLNGFLSEEASKWVKMFDDSFFEDLYKMHNWSWGKTAKRPGVVGRWINDLVYERIGPMVLPELQERNPTTEKGYRKYKHHQFLTADIGAPALRKHIDSLHTLAVASGYNWLLFKKLVNRVHPQKEQPLALFDLDPFDIE